MSANCNAFRTDEGCYSLRDITLGMNVNTLFLKELGLKQTQARSTMSDGNPERDY